MSGAEPRLQVRQASLNEAAVIASLLYEAFAEYVPLYTPQGFEATTPTSERILERWNEGSIWVATQDDTIVGTISAVPKGEALYLRSMAVLPTLRGQGVGKLLLEQVERFAREHRFKRMFLSTTPFLDRAIQLYEGWGFERKDDGPHDLYGTPLFTMEKSLKN